MVHLHTHSHYSSLDGMGKIDELVKRAKEMGQRALAITDHGVMYGIYDLYKECKEQNMIPLYGVEFYHKVEGYDKRFHLVAFAKTMKGLKTLYKLHEISHRNAEDGKFGKRYPIVTYTDLMQNHEDIIITSACLGGHIPQMIMEKKYAEIESTITMLKNIFGADFYLEIQPNKIPNQRIVNEELARLSKTFNIPLVMGCDAHYVYKTDASVHEMLLCMQTKKVMSDTERFKFSVDDFWLKSEEEVRESLKYLSPETVKAAIDNTEIITDLCTFEFELPKQEDALPKYSNDEKAVLRQACTDGWKELITSKHDTKVYKDRVNYELDVTESKGYSGYFNIVMDYTNWAKNNGIAVGGGRGSICGSEVGYLTRITNIDPIPQGLLFERFLNPERMSSPDIDIDFSDRDKVVQYLKERWGWENVSSVIAFGTLTAKAVIRKVMGIHEFTQAQINEVSKSLPKKLHLTLEDCEISHVFRQYKLKYPKLFDAMCRLEGVIDHTSTHAAGILITPKPIREFVPCGYDKANDILVSGFDKYMIEELGLYKFDILQLKTLNVINDTVNMIKKFDNIIIDLEKIDYEDKTIYNEMCKGNVFGTFQLESQQALTMKLKPRTFEDLTLLNTLIRPGVGDIDEYVARQEGKAYDIYSNEEDSYMLQSLYTIAYQEQTMLRVHTLAGWTLGKGDSLRKEKRIKENSKLANQFIEDAIKHSNLLFSDAHSAWEEITNALDGGYTFNKSHSASYAKIAFQTAWLKYYYPLYFMCAFMTSEFADQSRIAESVVQCKQLDITILPPDINKSTNIYKIEDKCIRFAINTIKGVGESALQAINELGYIQSLSDLYERGTLRVIDKSVVTALIMCGAFDFENTNRYELMYQYYMMRGDKKIAPAYKDKIITDEEIIGFEKQYLGLYLTKSPYDNYNFKSLQQFPDKTEALIGGEITKVKEIFDKNNRPMVFATLTTEYGNVELVVFSSSYKKCSDAIQLDKFIMCKGKRDNNKMLVDETTILR